MSDPRLAAILAIERDTGSRAKSVVTDAHRKNQQGAGYVGFARRYEPLSEDGEQLPAEAKRVQERVPDVLRDVNRALGSFFDASAAREYANCHARADVVVDGTTLMAQVPATYLLFLEKQLKDPIRTFVANLPTLDEAREWTWDAASSLWKTEETRRRRTSKEQTPIVLYDATAEHPAQTQLITKDIPVGDWIEVQHSGALPRDQKQALLDRVDKLSEAVKLARERANLQDAPTPTDARAALDFIFQD